MGTAWAAMRAGAAGWRWPSLGVSERAGTLWVLILEGELEAGPSGPRSDEFALRLDI